MNPRVPSSSYMPMEMPYFPCNYKEYNFLFLSLIFTSTSCFSFLSIPLSKREFRAVHVRKRMPVAISSKLKHSLLEGGRRLIKLVPEGPEAYKIHKATPQGHMSSNTCWGEETLHWSLLCRGKQFPKSAPMRRWALQWCSYPWVTLVPMGNPSPNFL